MGETADGMQRPHPFLTTIGFGGIQIVFALFFGQAVTHLKSLGLSPSEVAITLLSGPLCGAIFQPCFGIWSDQCQSSWGRRRPFIIIGTVFLILSMLSLAWAESITQLFLPYDAENGTYRKVLVTITILFTFTMFVSVQSVQVGLRALINDNCTPFQQAKANAWAGRHSNLAGFLGYLTAYTDFPRYFHQFGQTVFTDISLITTLYLAITITITCWFSSDDEQRASTFHKTQRIPSLQISWSVLFGSSSQIKTICLVQFFAWLGWFPFLFYTVTYVSSLSKDHVPVKAPTSLTRYFTDKPYLTNHNYNGSLAPLVYTTVALFMALLLPYQSFSRRTESRISNGKFLNFLTPRRLWISSHGIFGVSMLGTFFVTSPLGTVLLFSIVGISWAVTSRVPYSLLGDELSQPAPQDEGDLTDRQGLIYGIHSLAICLPQILMLLLMGAIWMFVGTKDGLGVVWFLRLGGVSALVAMYFATKLSEPIHFAWNSEYIEIPLGERVR